MANIVCPLCGRVNQVAGVHHGDAGLWRKKEDDLISLYCGFCAGRFQYDTDKREVVKGVERATNP